MRLRAHLLTACVLVVIVVAQQRTTPELVSRPRLGLPVNNGYPALARSASGTLWLAWVSNREQDRGVRGGDRELTRADHIILKKRDGKTWSQELVVSTEHSLNSDPTLAADGSGVHVIWTVREKGEFYLQTHHVNDTLQMSPPRRIGKGANAKAVTAPDGSVWVAWESFDQGFNRILVSRNFGEPELVSDMPAYRPNIAISRAGVVSVAWDGGRSERYSLGFRQYRDGRWQTQQRMPADANLDAYAPRIAAGLGDSVWVAYAQNPERAPEWGIRGWRPGAMPRPRVKAMEWTGARWRDPGFEAANADMPMAIASDKGGIQILFLRMLGHVNFRLWVSSFEAAGWTEPKQLDVNEEEYQAVRMPGAASLRLDQRPSAVIAGDKVVIAYERGTGVFENRQIAVREFDAASRPAPDNAGLYRDLTPTSSLQPAEKRSAAPAVNGFKVYFGELHMHLLMDDGHAGTADQYYTFARDRWGLDFAAYTPHAESNKLLASEVAMVQRVAPMFNQPGRFVGISGWEWTQGDFRVPQEGHKHVINETDDQPFFSATESTSDSARELTNLMKGTTGLMFAHHVARGAAGGTNFDAIDPTVEPSMEIASHWGRFEFYRNPGHTRDEIKGSSVQDAWKRALRIGVVGGSDNHDLFMERPSGFTAVLAESLDRRSLFDALRKRRCYATTGERIVLDVRVNGEPMGSLVRSRSAPVITVKAVGTDVVEKIEVIKFFNGVTEPFPPVYAVTPQAKDASFEWRDLDFRADSAYYVRLTQKADPRVVNKQNFGSATSFPNEMAWSSPIWVIRQ